MPGAWLLESRKQYTFETLSEPIFDKILLKRVCFWAQKVWSRFPGATLISAASGPLDRDPNDVATTGRASENDGSLQGPRSDESRLDASIMLNGTEVNCLLVESGPSVGNRSRLSTEMANRHAPSTTDDVTTQDLDSAQTATLDVVHEGEIGSVAPNSANPILREEDTSLNGDERGAEDRIDGIEDEGAFGAGIQHSGISLSERMAAYRAVGRQESALSNTRCSLPLRRAHSIERDRDVSHEGDDDSYWTEQVSARLCDVRPYRYGFSEFSPWPREGREGESDNWRVRHSSVASFVASDGETKYRRHSSPPVSVNASLADRAGRYVYRFISRGRHADLDK